MNRLTMGLTGIQVKVVALAIMLVAFSATAMAQCGYSFNAMASAAASVQSQSQKLPSSVQNNAPGEIGNETNASIVGLWHIRFQVDGHTIQEAFQIWNTGGTEVHNPNVDPRGGSVCLGTWEQAPHRTFKLTHRVWNYDVNGNFLGTIKLNETIELNSSGDAHSGTFTLDFYDPDGKFKFQVPGNVIAERISVE